MARQRKSTLHVQEWHVSKHSYALVASGQKLVLIVPNHSYFVRLHVGMPMRIVHGGKSIMRTVVATRPYADIYTALTCEDLAKICHGTYAQTLGYLDRVYKRSEMEGTILAIEFAPV